MIAGFSGHLISESFLEQSVAARGAEDHLLHRRLTDWQRRRGALGPASSLRAIFETAAREFVTALNFDVVDRVEPLRDAMGALVVAGKTPVSLVVTRWGERLDPFWRPAVVLAVERHADWCLLFNGATVRLIDARRLYSRRFAQFDFDAVLDDETAIAALTFVLGRPSMLGALIDASDRHASNLCVSLRAGVLEASAGLVTAMAAGRPTQALSSTFEQALTIVYRILFLLFAETRGLVPMWHPVYRTSYSIESLIEMMEANRPAVGLWEALQSISRLAHSGCSAGDLRITPFNGRLFAPSRTPLAERRNLDDQSAGRAILALTTCTRPDRQGRARIPYRDLGVEQLGGVYETLLDYEPHVEGASVLLRPGSGKRKATGTFYTPQPIAQYLVRTTLEPLVRDRSAAGILELKILDPAMGSGAFLVAACRYLSQAYEASLVREDACHATDLGREDQAGIRRTIAERCLFGVDVDPMAVQLARLSLWLATLAADRPLTFLDHHLATGDSLLGAWLSDIRLPPGQSRQSSKARLPLFEEEAVAEAMKLALPVRFSLALSPNESVQQIREKERALAALARHDSPLSQWKRAADLWCAYWFGPDGARIFPPSSFGALSDHILHGRSALPARLAGGYLSQAREIATARRFLHWELEFPEAFFDEHGDALSRPGFDAVVGNPPWDMLRADDGPPEQRRAARADTSAVVRFTRDSGVYRAQSSGHANRYQLFLERAIRLARSGGRIGLVLPSGFATDHGSAALRRELLSRWAIDGLVGFDNRRRVFPVHPSVRFLLLTATSGEKTDDIGCRFGESDPLVLETSASEAGAPSWFTVRVTPRVLERLSGDDLAIPDLRSPIDLAIAQRAADLFRPLGSEQGWKARFGRELNATDDRQYFHHGRAGIPIVEGKALEPFRVNLRTVRQRISTLDRRRLLASRPERPRLGYRDVASATNRRTLIAAILPRRSVSTHTVFCLKTPCSLQKQHFLCGLFNSFVVNYLVRLRVTTHVATGIVERLPIPLPDEAPGAFDRIAAAARLLARRTDPAAFALLNATVARLYRLNREEFEHVLGTFPLIPAEERLAALSAFRAS